MTELERFRLLRNRGPNGIVRLNRNIVTADDNDVLIHYGILGQKWGIRRFQNEDRSYTEAGKKRYTKEATDERKAKRREEKRKLKEARAAEKKARKEAKERAKPESARWKSKDARYLSDEELNRRNSRLQRERQYIDMTTPGWKKAARRGAIAFIGALTLLPLMKIATDSATKIYRGKFNEFVAPELQKRLHMDSLTLKNKG